MLTGGQAGGQVHDIIGGRALLARLAAMRQFIGDKAYDADDMRDFLAAQGTEAVISPMPRRLTPPSFNPIASRMRNLIERAFCKLKDWRGIATRYGKTARNFHAGVCLAVSPHALAELSPHPRDDPGVEPGQRVAGDHAASKHFYLALRPVRLANVRISGERRH